MIQDESLLKIYCESTYLGIKIKYAMVYEQVKENIAGKNGKIKASKLNKQQPPLENGVR